MDSHRDPSPTSNENRMALVSSPPFVSSPPPTLVAHMDHPGSPNSFQHHQQQQVQLQELATVSQYWVRVYCANTGSLFSGKISLAHTSTGDSSVRLIYETVQQHRHLDHGMVHFAQYDYGKYLVTYPLSDIVAFKLAPKREEVKLLMQPPSKPVSIMFDKKEHMHEFFKSLGKITHIPIVPMEQITLHLPMDEMFNLKEAYFFVDREFPTYCSNAEWETLTFDVILADLEADYRKNISTLNEDNLVLPEDLDEFRVIADQILKRLWARYQGKERNESKLHTMLVSNTLLFPQPTFGDHLE